jgi:ketosteroid isomerase-like protein
VDETEVARLHDAYVAAWQRDDRETAMSFWDDEVVMHAPGSNPHSGTYRGKATVQQQLIDRIYAETASAEVLQLVYRGIGRSHVFTIVRERFTKANGRVLETDRIVIYEWSKARITRILYFDPDQAAADAFWAD